MPPAPPPPAPTTASRSVRTTAGSRTGSRGDAGLDRGRTRIVAWLAAVPAREAIRARSEEILKADSTAYQALAGGRHVLRAEEPAAQAAALSCGADRSRGLGHDRANACCRPEPSWTRPVRRRSTSSGPPPTGTLVAVSLSRDGTETAPSTLRRHHRATWASRSLTSTAVGRIGGLEGRREGVLGHPAPRRSPRGKFLQEVCPRDGSRDDPRELAGVFADDRIAENFLSTSPDGRWVLDRVQKGDGGEWQMFLRVRTGRVAGDRGPGRPLVRPSGRRRALRAFGQGCAARPDLNLPIATGVTAADAEVVVPDVSAPSRASRSPTAGSGWSTSTAAPPGCGVHARRRPLGRVEVPGDLRGRRPRGSGPTRTGRWSLERSSSPAVVGGLGRSSASYVGLGTRTPIDLSGFTVRRVFATSADGTQVPINLIARPDVEPGLRPRSTATAATRSR